MDNYDDGYTYEDKDTFKDSHRPRIGKYVKKVLKYIVILLIAFVYFMIFMRSSTAKVPKKFREFTWTDVTREVYSTNGALTVMKQKSEDAIDKNGLYQISDIYICPDADQVQFTVRYNSRNTINQLMENYSMTDRPTGEIFVFRLRDGDGNIYTEYRYSAAKKPLNEFRKVVFDNVKVPGEGGILYLEVYYGDDVRDHAPMNVTLTVYDADRYTEKVNVSPKDSEFELLPAPSYLDRHENSSN